MRKSNWPKTVPILNESDLTRGHFDSACGKKHCTLGWLRIVFPDGPTRTKARVAVAKAISLATKRKCDSTSIVSFNDSALIPLKKIARAFNAAMRSLGYDRRVRGTY